MIKFQFDNTRLKEGLEQGRALGNLGFPLAEKLKPLGFKEPEIIEGDVKFPPRPPFFAKATNGTP